MKSHFVSFLFFVSTLAYAGDHKLTANIASYGERGDEGAYIVESFKIDGAPFSMWLGDNQVKHLLWHLDGKVVAVKKDGNTFALGLGEVPTFDVTTTGTDVTMVTMDFPYDFEVVASCKHSLWFPFFSGDNPVGIFWARISKSHGKISDTLGRFLELFSRQFQIRVKGHWLNR